MSENDLQSTITTRLNGTLQPLDQAASKVDALTRSVAKLHQSSGNYQQQAGKPFREAGHHAQEAGKLVHEYARAVERLKGPAGEIVGRALGGVGMGSTVGRVAVAAGVSGLALEAYNRVIDANIDRTEKAIKAAHDYEDALERGQKAAGRHALAGLSHEDAVREVIRVGGREYQRKAEQIAKEDGVGLDEAYGGFAQLGKIRNLTARGRAVTAAREYAKAGGSFGEAAGEISNNRMLQSRLMVDGVSEQDVAAMILQKKNTGSYAGANTGTLRLRQAEIANSAYVGQGIEANKIQTRIAMSEMGRVESGEAVGTLKGQLGEAVSPVTAELVKLNLANGREVAAMEQLAAVQGKLAGLLIDLVSPKGSLTTQYRRTLGAAGSGD